MAVKSRYSYMCAVVFGETHVHTEAAVFGDYCFGDPSVTLHGVHNPNKLRGSPDLNIPLLHIPTFFRDMMSSPD